MELISFSVTMGNAFLNVGTATEIQIVTTRTRLMNVTAPNRSLRATARQRSSCVMIIAVYTSRGNVTDILIVTMTVMRAIVSVSVRYKCACSLCLLLITVKANAMLSVFLTLFSITVILYTFRSESCYYVRFHTVPMFDGSLHQRHSRM